jgi:hypothetical protein
MCHVASLSNLQCFDYRVHTRIDGLCVSHSAPYIKKSYVCISHPYQFPGAMTRYRVYMRVDGLPRTRIFREITVDVVPAKLTNLEAAAIS